MVATGSARTAPFTPMTSGLRVPVDTNGANVDVSEDFIPATANAVRISNSNACWVRMSSTRRGQTPDRVASDGTPPVGIELAPGAIEIFGTQRPVKVSALAVDREGFALADVETFHPIELVWGSAL